MTLNDDGVEARLTALDVDDESLVITTDVGAGIGIGIDVETGKNEATGVVLTIAGLHKDKEHGPIFYILSGDHAAFIVTQLVSSLGEWVEQASPQSLIEMLTVLVRVQEKGRDKGEQP